MGPCHGMSLLGIVEEFRRSAYQYDQDLELVELQAQGNFPLTRGRLPAPVRG